jgi:hypothetical protein
MGGHLERKRVDAAELRLLRQDVHRVLHRVRGDDLGVVAGEVGVGEVAPQDDVHGHFEQLVQPDPAHDLRQPHAALAVGVVLQFGRHVLSFSP